MLYVQHRGIPARCSTPPVNLRERPHMPCNISSTGTERLRNTQLTDSNTQKEYLTKLAPLAEHIPEVGDKAHPQISHIITHLRDSSRDDTVFLKAEVVHCLIHSLLDLLPV